MPRLPGFPVVGFRVRGADSKIEVRWKSDYAPFSLRRFVNNQLWCRGVSNFKKVVIGEVETQKVIYASL